MAQQYPKIAIFIFYGLLIGILLNIIQSLQIVTDTVGFVVGGAIGGYISLFLWQKYGSKMITTNNSFY